MSKMGDLAREIQARRWMVERSVGREVRLVIGGKIFHGVIIEAEEVIVTKPTLSTAFELKVEKLDNDGQRTGFWRMAYLDDLPIGLVHHADPGQMSFDFTTRRVKSEKE